ncbi:uncharacterized protein LOC109504429 isoform X2 [Harpegnathos saltator]|uniref:uncharacterized protein LOC109504429 isoform X2 n=1 Tax=Harpegnathos saltator TaxID=610380 RepID=UPI000949037F|nr:uncharacterized protein LOC109504429 isoform X2 [Harpegnathos saltator]
MLCPVYFLPSYGMFYSGCEICCDLIADEHHTLHHARSSLPQFAPIKSIETGRRRVAKLNCSSTTIADDRWNVMTRQLGAGRWTLKAWMEGAGRVSTGVTMHRVFQLHEAR